MGGVLMARQKQKTAYISETMKLGTASGRVLFLMLKLQRIALTGIRQQCNCRCLYMLSNALDRMTATAPSVAQYCPCLPRKSAFPRTCTVAAIRPKTSRVQKGVYIAIVDTRSESKSIPSSESQTHSNKDTDFS